MAILEVKNLYKSFGDNLVLNDISFSVKKGEVLSIIGPSGSGKSTLLRCINQLEDISKGQIMVCDLNMIARQDENTIHYENSEQLRKIQLCVGLVFQNFNLFPHLNVLHNITLAPINVLSQKKDDAEETAMKLLDKMGLRHKASSYPYELSGGQQQRISIARALALSPQILFFDEPTSALDPELTGEILEVIKELANEHMTMVIVTHEMSFAKDVSDKIIFLDEGKIALEGMPEEVFANNKNSRIQSFLKRFKDAF